MKVPLDYWRLLRWILIGILVVAAAGVGYYFYRKHRKGEPLFHKTVIRPAHEIALERLQALKTTDLDQMEQYKTFFTELSNIVREYIENRYFVKALEETSTELLQSMQELELDAETLQKLQNVLQMSDLVKFAKFVPGKAEVESSLQDAESFIHMTKLEFEAVEVEEPVEKSSEVEESEVEIKAAEK